ncbi:hypothetical protein BVX93_00275 [bacterium B13(2017)]|nr:hypothetical protein BVX93_00275 [bacterium B13(2017)]
MNTIDKTNIIQEIDTALNREKKHETEPIKNWKGLSILPILMRWIGCAVLTTGAITFMLQGIQMITPMTRHWLFLFITTILGGIGFALGKYMKEYKGARTFLGLCIASLPVLSSQLGGMVYSFFRNGLPNMPETMIFSATSISSVIVTIAITFLFMYPIVYFGFSIFSRSKSKILTIIYFIANSFILIPIRDNALVAFILLVIGIMLYILEKEHLKNSIIFDSFEGKISRIILSLPLAVIFIRSLFYPLHYFFFSTLLFSVGIFLCLVVSTSKNNSEPNIFLFISGTISTIFGWIVFYYGACDHYFADSYIQYYFLILPICGILYTYSFNLKNNDDRYFRNIASLGALYVTIKVLINSSSIITSLISIIIGTLFISTSVIQKEKIPFVVGGVSIFGGLCYYLKFALEIYTNSIWISLIVTGILILITSSFIETKALAIKNRFLYYKKSLKNWN